MQCPKLLLRKLPDYLQTTRPAFNAFQACIAGFQRCSTGPGITKLKPIRRRLFTSGIFRWIWTGFGGLLEAPSRTLFLWFSDMDYGSLGINEQMRLRFSPYLVGTLGITTPAYM